MSKSKFVLVFLLFISSFKIVADENLKEMIRVYLENKPMGERYQIDKSKLFSSVLLPKFYGDRVFSSAWIQNGKLNSQALQVMKFIREIHTHGFTPNDYHLKALEFYAIKFRTPIPLNLRDLLHIEVLLTDACLLLGSHLYFGKVDIEKAVADWHIQRKDPDLKIDERLAKSLESNLVLSYFEGLMPQFDAYKALVAHLSFWLNESDAHWKELKTDKAIRPNEKHVLIETIRKKLCYLEYPCNDTLSDVYSPDLVPSILLFQEDNGFNKDSVIGKNFLSILSLKPSERIKTLRVNLERLRWLPSDFPEKYIIVNIANQQLDFIGNNDTLLSCRAIIGKTYRTTPVFSARMTYLVFSPTWTVPPGILAADVIPQLKKGPEYLQKNKMRILKMNGTEVEYNAIDWKKVSANRFPYLIKQDPGPHNSLGLVKFMFPNTYNVYIHDTPNRSLFLKDDRAQSSGCIRIEKPFDLARLLLSGTGRWNDSTIYEAMHAGRERTVSLPSPLPVFVVYLTAWTQTNGKLAFRKDIYQRDDEIFIALNEKPIAYWKDK
jgi:murein L,D-transpeptidase YcbB/YkuD